MINVLLVHAFKLNGVLRLYALLTTSPVTMMTISMTQNSRNTFIQYRLIDNIMSVSRNRKSNPCLLSQLFYTIINDAISPQ